MQRGLLTQLLAFVSPVCQKWCVWLGVVFACNSVLLTFFTYPPLTHPAAASQRILACYRKHQNTLARTPCRKYIRDLKKNVPPLCLARKDRPSRVVGRYAQTTKDYIYLDTRHHNLKFHKHNPLLPPVPVPHLPVFPGFPSRASKPSPRGSRSPYRSSPRKGGRRSTSRSSTPSTRSRSTGSRPAAP